MHDKKNGKMQTVTLPHLGKVFCTGKEEALFTYEEIFVKKDYLLNSVALKAGDTIFDVGAHIGLFSLFVNELCGGKMTLFAFEPVPFTYSVLKANLDRKGMLGKPSVNLFNIGLTNIGGPKSATFTYFWRMSGNSTMNSTEKQEEFISIDVRDVLRAIEKDNPLVYYFLKGIPFKSWLLKKLMGRLLESEEIECSLVPLSEIIVIHEIEKIDLLKIDVEGAELEVLNGIGENQWPIIRQVVMEVHDVKGRLDSIINLLRDKGFKVVNQQPSWAETFRINTWNVFALR